MRLGGAFAGAAAGAADAGMIGAAAAVLSRAAIKATAIAALLLAVLPGCGTTGIANGGLAQMPIPPGKARVTLTRASSMLYAGAPATITHNGTKVADLASGGAAIVDVPAGDNVFEASAWSYPGSYKIRLSASAGASYAIEVSPRSSSFLPGALLGPIGGAIDAGMNENAGAFEMRVVPPGGGAVAGN